MKSSVTHRLRTTRFVVASLLFIACTPTFAIEGEFAPKANPAMAQAIEAAKDPAAKELMANVAKATAERFVLRKGEMVHDFGGAVMTYKLSEHGQFLLGTYKTAKGKEELCCIYIKDEDTLVFGDKYLFRVKTSGK